MNHSRRQSGPGRRPPSTFRRGLSAAAGAAIGASAAVTWQGRGLAGWARGGAPGPCLVNELPLRHTKGSNSFVCSSSLASSVSRARIVGQKGATGPSCPERTRSGDSGAAAPALKPPWPSSVRGGGARGLALRRAAAPVPPPAPARSSVTQAARTAGPRACQAHPLPRQ